MTTERSKVTDEAEIRRQVYNFVKAFRTKDLNLMMSLYVPEMVSFDIVPPLQDVGKDTYRKVWEETFSLFKDPIDIEIRDLKITTCNDVAFSHNLLHLNAMKVSGEQTDYWERLTFCFQKIHDKWLVVHEHVSVPVDFRSGKAVLNLEP